MTPEVRARAAFYATWGSAPQWVARAPGRVNLIGEHTDYNDGFVLPCAIGFETVVAAGPGEPGMLEAVAANYGNDRERMTFDSAFAPQGGWRDYVRGMAHVLRESGQLNGARLAIAGNVPAGAGLSSSAALEIAVAHALLALADRDMVPDAMAQAAQRAENDFVGAQCGIMDQLISARGMNGHALLIDCRSLVCTPVAMPPDAAIVIIHSGVRHTHAGGAYNDRRAQCEAAARHYGVAALRDLEIAKLVDDARDLDDLAFRRARHVVTENDRTLAAAAALASGDLRAMGALMAASHISMRDDFEITIPAIDKLVEIADSVICGNGGARMTGGGFGGCIVALAPNDAVDALREAVASRYVDPEGKPAQIYVCTASNGATIARA